MQNSGKVYKCFHKYGYKLQRWDYNHTKKEVRLRQRKVGSDASKMLIGKEKMVSTGGKGHPCFVVIGGGSGSVWYV